MRERLSTYNSRRPMLVEHHCIYTGLTLNWHKIALKLNFIALALYQFQYWILPPWIGLPQLYNLEQSTCKNSFSTPFLNLFADRWQLLSIQSCRENICLQTLLLLFKCANHWNKRPFVSTANEALVGTLMGIGDVNDIFELGPLWNEFKF